MEPKIVEKILSLYGNGATFREVEKKLKLSEGFVFRTIQQYATSEIRVQHNKNVIARQQKKADVHIETEKIFNELESGMQLYQIVDNYGISYNLLVNRMKEYVEMHGIKEINGVKIEQILVEEHINKGRPSKKKVDIPMERIIEYWKSGKKMQELADEYGVRVNVLYQRLRESGLKLKRGRKSDKTHINNVPISVIIEELGNGASYAHLSKKYEIPASTIWHCIRKYEQENGKIIKNDGKNRQENAKSEDIVEEKAHTKPKAKNDKINNIWQEYTNGVPVSELASRYKMSETTLKRLLNTYQDYLLTKAYVHQNKSIAELSRETNLPISNVKERVIKVLRQKIPVIEPAWYMVTRSKGYTVEETLKMYMLKQKQAVTQKRNVASERE